MNEIWYLGEQEKFKHFGGKFGFCLKKMLLLAKL